MVNLLFFVVLEWQNDTKMINLLFGVVLAIKMTRNDKLFSIVFLVIPRPGMDVKFIESDCLFLFEVDKGWWIYHLKLKYLSKIIISGSYQ